MTRAYTLPDTTTNQDKICDHLVVPRETYCDVIVCSPEQVRDFTKQMLGYNLVTHQTGPEGQLCQKVLVNEGITIDSEKYLAIIMDRETDGPCIVARSAHLSRMLLGNPDLITNALMLQS